MFKFLKQYTAVASIVLVSCAVCMYFNNNHKYIYLSLQSICALYQAYFSRKGGVGDLIFKILIAFFLTPFYIAYKLIKKLKLLDMKVV